MPEIESLTPDQWTPKHGSAIAGGFFILLGLAILFWGKLNRGKEAKSGKSKLSKKGVTK
jgi:hypothetical protein